MFGLPGGVHPPGLRPAHRLVDPPHPRAPRAGRRPHGRGLRPRHRPPRRGHGDERARRPPTSSRRCATPTWTRSRWSSSPARCPTAAIGTDAFQECDTVGITRSVTKHNELVTDGRGHPAGHPRGVPHRHHRPARPGARSTSRRTCLQNTMEWYWPTDDEVATPARLPPERQGPPADDQGGGAS